MQFKYNAAIHLLTLACNLKCDKNVLICISTRAYDPGVGPWVNYFRNSELCVNYESRNVLPGQNYPQIISAEQVGMGEQVGVGKQLGVGIIAKLPVSLTLRLHQKASRSERKEQQYLCFSVRHVFRPSSDNDSNTHPVSGREGGGLLRGYSVHALLYFSTDHYISR